MTLEDNDTNVQLILRGTLAGHTGWVTKIAPSASLPDTLITASRDRTLLIWKMSVEGGSICGKTVRSLIGHNHFVSDCVLSSDGGFVISSSWDKTLRLWDIEHGVTKRRFIGHTNDVLSVTFSSDNRQIISGSRDQTVRLWNTLAVQKCVFDREMDGHKSSVSSVAMTPSVQNPLIISGGWDKMVKVWSMKPFGFVCNLVGHNKVVNDITLSPDGALCASGGKDGQVLFWNLERFEHEHSFQFNDSVSAISFNPYRYLVAVSHGKEISLIDVKKWQLVETLKVLVDGVQTKTPPECTTISWSHDGLRLYSGHTDNLIRIWAVEQIISDNKR